MKTKVTLYMFVCLLLSQVQPSAADSYGIVHFTLFLRSNTVVRLDSKMRALNIERSAFNIVSYQKNGDSFGQERRLEWPEITSTIYSIDLVNPNRMAYSKAKLLLTRQDGTQFVIKYGSLYHAKDGTLLDEFYFSEYNRIAGQWADRKIPIETVKKVVLGTTRLKINPVTGTLYPPDYRYDPRTGEALVESALIED